MKNMTGLCEPTGATIRQRTACERDCYDRGGRDESRPPLSPSSSGRRRARGERGLELEGGSLALHGEAKLVAGLVLADEACQLVRARHRHTVDFGDDVTGLEPGIGRGATGSNRVDTCSAPR